MNRQNLAEKQLIDANHVESEYCSLKLKDSPPGSEAHRLSITNRRADDECKPQIGSELLVCSSFLSYFRLKSSCMIRKRYQRTYNFDL